jgi:hypothetical protein
LDADGQNSLSEFIAGTNPNAADSVLQITSLELDPGGSPQIEWASVAGKEYRVGYSPDLVVSENSNPR